MSFIKLCIISFVALIAGSFSVYAQDDIGIQHYWSDGQPGFNIFQLRERLKTDKSLSDFQRHLALTYLHIYALDFDKADAAFTLAQEDISEEEVEEEINKQIYDVSKTLLRAKKSYGQLAELYADVEGQDNIWANYYSKLSSYTSSLKRQSKQYEVKNLASDPAKKVTIQSINNDHSVELLFDTGGFLSIIQPKEAKAANIIVSDVSLPIAGVGFEESLTLAQVKTLAIGGVTQKDTPILVPHSETSIMSSHVLGELDGLLGMQQISKLGRVSLIVENATVSSLRFDFPSIEEVNDIPQNLLIRENKLIAEIKIDNQIYSCLLDTGSPITILSEDIYKRHKASNALKRISSKAASYKGLSGYFSKKPAFLERLDIEIAGEIVQFSNVELVDFKGRPDYCFIGLDSIIKAGGATIDVSNLMISFGGR